MGVKVRVLCDGSHLSKSGYSYEEQAEIYDRVLEDVYNNPRWYLDNLHNLITFKVSWANYHKGLTTKPAKYVKRRKV